MVNERFTLLSKGKRWMFRAETATTFSLKVSADCLLSILPPFKLDKALDLGLIVWILTNILHQKNLDQHRLEWCQIHVLCKTTTSSTTTGRIGHRAGRVTMGPAEPLIQAVNLIQSRLQRVRHTAAS